MRGARLDEEAAAAAARRHAVHLARVAAESAARVGAEGAEAAGDPLVPWRADLEAAFRYALDRRDADLALDLAAGFGALHHRYGTVRARPSSASSRRSRSAAARRRSVSPRCGGTFRCCCASCASTTRARRSSRRASWSPTRRPAMAGGLRVLEGQVELCAGNLEAAEALLDGLAGELARRGEWFTAGNAAWGLGTMALAARRARTKRCRS